MIPITHPVKIIGGDMVEGKIKDKVIYSTY